jgi:hypothetical protein
MSSAIPFFGARKLARQYMEERDAARAQLERIAGMARALVTETKSLRASLEQFGGMTLVDRLKERAKLENDVASLVKEIGRKRDEADKIIQDMNLQVANARRTIVVTEETALLQEVGIYRYRHPLTDAVSYEKALDAIDQSIKRMVSKDGNAVQSETEWTVNGSATQGRAMVKEISKLMLRAFNAEADNLVRGLKPYKLDSAIERLRKVTETIARLGKTMHIQISSKYLELRIRELELTADFLQKQAEEKEEERREREKEREERKVQQEIERERARLEKERQHHENALTTLQDKGDHDGAARIRVELQKIDDSMKEVDYRAANTKVGYVYVISNIGSFGDKVIKVGLTRRLDPYERIRELSDASVPFNFDVHAVHFSKDAVGIEAAMHDRLASVRVNTVNQRREFFYASPSEAKKHLAALAGELLQFTEVPEAIEYRQCMQARNPAPTIAPSPGSHPADPHHPLS